VIYLVRLSGFTAAAAAARADSALEKVGLLDAARRPLGSLSKGMRQRAKLAGAITGRALYDGRLDPGAALALVAGRR
jgi:phosphoribosylformimino-5-aminoimidazole carboxamide ribotide isomerase